MDEILIISSAQKTAASLHELLRGNVGGEPRIYTSARVARREGERNRPGIILINAPLSDEFGDELASWYVAAGCCPILLAPGEVAEELAERLEGEEVMVIEKPLNKGLLLATVRFARVAARRVEVLGRENARLRAKAEEAWIVGRAKCALIQYCDMTEAQAHRSVEQRAMDGRVTKLEIARDILDQFEG